MLRLKEIYHNTELAHFNPKPVFNRPAILVESRNIFRHKFWDLVGSDLGGGITFNEIIMTVAELNPGDYDDLQVATFFDDLNCLDAVRLLDLILASSHLPSRCWRANC